MNKESIQRFELSELVLQYDFATYTLLCRNISEGKNLWIRKIEDGGFILEVLEDRDKIFISVESEGKNGQFIVLNKSDGFVCWFIPGKPFMFRLYSVYVYLIFADSDNNFFLIKAHVEDGSKLWHHQINQGLSSYIINNEIVSLKYKNGSTEILNSETGLYHG